MKQKGSNGEIQVDQLLASLKTVQEKTGTRRLVRDVIKKVNEAT
ncbi:MAG: hypothetical protein O7H41_21715 [Planctomycetota bacterium]|nr:hypothetical protein [Planctomycetota bacterium]